MPAVEALTAEGINVNITLMFSLEHYEAVAQAYLRGIRRHPEPHRVTSVASVFVSRLDAVADRLLEKIGSPDALALRGRIAIANARRSTAGSVSCSMASLSHPQATRARSKGPYGRVQEPRMLRMPMSSISKP